MTDAPPLLDARKVSIAFGGLLAVQNFSLSLPHGALHGLIGPNGAGKTTIFNLLTGVYCPQSGSVWIDGKRVDKRKSYQIAQAGLSRTFQNIRLFHDLSVLDNIRIGCQLRHPFGLWSTMIRSRRQVRDERAILAKANELLEIFHLTGRAHDEACNLPYGDQRRLEIARTLATQPKVLLLDEPAAGMNPQEKVELMNLIRFIRDRFQIGILLIEHDMKLVMSICERITVLDHGETIAVGTPQQVQCDSKVIEAYLGEAPRKLDGDEMILTVNNLEVSYGAIKALHGVSLQIDRGEIVTLIGANGAGKTTLLRAISGLIRSQSGEMEFESDGRMISLTRMKAHQIVRHGISHSPEGRQVFATLTVQENLRLGGYQQPAENVQTDMERCFGLFPVLKERRNQKSGTLSGGEQQMLAIGRALMARPKLLLLDEPSLGLAPLIVRKIFSIIQEINAAGTTVFLVEQNAHLALHIAHRAYVLQTGKIIKSDAAKNLLEDPEVKKAYLGG